MHSAWQYRCPRGHSSIEGRSESYYRCQSCDRRYQGSPLDAREHEFPLDDIEDYALSETPHELEVLGELVARCSDGRSGLKAREIQAGPRASVAQRLSQLYERGFVDKLERATGARWKPTEAGKRLGGRSGGGE